MIISRDVVFINEEQKFQPKDVGEQYQDQPVEFIELLDWSETNAHPENEGLNVQQPARNQEMSSSVEIAEASTALPPQSGRSADEQQGFRRSGRERQPPGKYSDFMCFSSITGPDDFTDPTPMASEMADDPSNYTEAIERSDRERWITAMREEIQALTENETWELTDLPNGRKAIKNKWIYKTKRGSDGTVERFKARLVVKGCSQRYGVDFDECCGMVKRSNLRKLSLCIATHLLSSDP